MGGDPYGFSGEYYTQKGPLPLRMMLHPQEYIHPCNGLTHGVTISRGSGPNIKSPGGASKLAGEQVSTLGALPAGAPPIQLFSRA